MFVSKEVDNIEYRVENKYFVSDADLALIGARLRAAMRQDIHQDGESYNIRSLYFDDYWDSCMEENEAGLDDRRKFRIRIYDVSAEQMYLQIKSKLRGYTKKQDCMISRAECEKLIQGECVEETDAQRPVLNLLGIEMKTRLMRPKVIISYERTAFVCPLGNVRITFDRNILASRACGDFLQEDVTQNIPVLPKNMHILEVKYDEFLPDFIAQLLEIGKLRQTAFSKYYFGRMAVNGETAE